MEEVGVLAIFHDLEFGEAPSCILYEEAEYRTRSFEAFVDSFSYVLNTFSAGEFEFDCLCNSKGTISSPYGQDKCIGKGSTRTRSRYPTVAIRRPLFKAYTAKEMRQRLTRA